MCFAVGRLWCSRGGNGTVGRVRAAVSDGRQELSL